LVPEPNTWRDLLHALDVQAPVPPGAPYRSLELRDRRVAVQEYGISNVELLAGLRDRGALVMSVPVYEWTLPEDTAPLKAAIKALAEGEVDVAMFTSSAQVQHLLQVAADMGMRDRVVRSFHKVLVASIGPITSEELGQHGISADMEPSHPKMGFLVKETAERSQALLEEKRA
jgi:uroporphyrinogen-III synthase